MVVGESSHVIDKLALSSTVPKAKPSWVPLSSLSTTTIRDDFMALPHLSFHLTTADTRKRSTGDDSESSIVDTKRK
ncbi:unnamed protein product [Rodentolepis nana]|uniref:Uncharacterized protein n=1 Tax=Rodentolepis nana TaxID=102285 RepID=A0A0R3TFP4_RODNA|nr:unnamed protein product [Rodentolepis nana]